jgi:hypothetical protein
VAGVHSRAMRRGVLTAAAAAAFFMGVVGAAHGGPLRTAIVDPAHFGDLSRQDTAFGRAVDTGATMVRLQLVWRAVAPDARTKPDGFVAEDPRAPQYNQSAWNQFDRQVIKARAHGLEPIVYLQSAPEWAEGPGPGPDGTVRPDPLEMAKFARAVARRYSGTLDVNLGNQNATPVLLPRVRFFQVWNEPNRDYFLRPQYENGRIASAALYRTMVNRVAFAVHDENPTNVVIAGGLAPLGRPGKPGPMAFMREMLCISRSLRRTCDLRSNPVELDVWSHHPYTSGGPMHHAPTANDASLGDLPEMRALLRAAIRAGHVRSRARVGFWVTEFSWDSRPPDPRALRAGLHARWTAEALYRMWKNGVSVVTWYRVQDDPLSVSPYQSGFYGANGRRKLAFTAFRFPVVAFRRRGGIYVWGRTPVGQPGRVTVQIKRGSRWRNLGRVRANAYGIFSRTYRTPVRRGYVRARFGREASLGFSLTPVADRYVNPFGCGGVSPC